MAGTTTKGLRFPQDADAPNIAVDFQNLATDIDSELDDYLLTATANSTFAPSANVANLDEIRVVTFMLGGM